MSSPNSALLLAVGTASAQRARLTVAIQILEAEKASALADERYERCATLRDALVPLKSTAAGGDAELPPPSEGALVAALGGAGQPTSNASSLHPSLRCSAWRADNRYFSAEIDLLALSLEEPPVWPAVCAAVLGEQGPAGASKRRCQALVAVVDADTSPDALAALAAAAEEAEPELLLLCELGATPAAAAAAAAATGAREDRLAKMEGGGGGDAEGPLWEWSVANGFEHLVLPWHVAVGAPAELLGAAGSPEPAEGSQHGLGRVAEALQNTMWSTLAMKPQPEQPPVTGRGGGSQSRTAEEIPAAEAVGNSALIVNFIAEDETDESEEGGSDGGSAVTSASIATALGLGSEFSAVPAVATWRVRNRYFTADIALRFIDASTNAAQALEAASAALSEQAQTQTQGSKAVSRCGAVILLLSSEMGRSPAASASLKEWSDLLATFTYPEGCTGPEMLALCVNQPPYTDAIEWCAEHGYELVRPSRSSGGEEDGSAEDSEGAGDSDGAVDGGRGADKEGVWRLVEALQQNVWGTVRMHEQAAPSPAPQSDTAETTAKTSGGSTSDAAVALETLLSGGGDGDADGGNAGGGDSGGAKQAQMPDMEKMFQEVNSFKASSSSMSREQRHAAAEQIAMAWGLAEMDDGAISCPLSCPSHFSAGGLAHSPTASGVQGVIAGMRRTGRHWRRS